MNSNHDTSGDPALLACYLANRAVLVRFFTLRTGSRDAAEDIVQDIALRIGDVTLADAAQVRNPLAFIYRIGSNIMLDRIKSARRASGRDLAWTQVHVSDQNGFAIADAPDPDAAMTARQRLSRINAIVETMGPQRQRVFRLHKLEGLTHQEVATRLGISRSAVEKHISMALKTLVAALQ